MDLKKDINEHLKRNDLRGNRSYYSFFEKNGKSELYNYAIKENEKRGFYNISISQAFYNILNDIYEFPVCVRCSKKRKFNNFSHGYYGCNDKKCISKNKSLTSKSIEEKRKKVIEKYIPIFNEKYEEEYLKVCTKKIKQKKYSIGYVLLKDEILVNQIYSRTKYLKGVKFFERIYHINNDLNEIQLCIVCGTKLRWTGLKYKGCCRSNIFYYNGKVVKNKKMSQTAIENMKIAAKKSHNKEWGCKVSSALSGREFTDKHRKNLSIGCRRAWKEGKQDKGLQTRKENGCYERHSIFLKEQIEIGKFTPCITNSWSNSRCKIAINGFGAFYRSSWDAAFQILNPECIYEKTRIKYFSHKYNKHRIFIVDFLDPKMNHLYEIKPNAHLESQDTKDKINGLKTWCKENNHTFSLISNDWFKKNASKIEYSEYDNKIFKGMKQFLC